MYNIYTTIKYMYNPTHLIIIESISNGERTDQSHRSIVRIVQMQLVNSLSSEISDRFLVSIDKLCVL